MLPAAQVFNLDGTLNDSIDGKIPAEYAGLERFEARKQIVAAFDAAGLLVSVDDHNLKVPKGDRSGTVIEPWLTDQWYVSTKPLAEPAIAAVEDGRIQFVPKQYENMYFSWMRDIRTGASAVNCGGATGFRRGTTSRARSTSVATKPKYVPSTTSARTLRCNRTTTCSTPGSARACGRSPLWVGRKRPSS